ncbi:hypothetical protein BZG36_00561 [Bifiguratus adelaidae]|uniref:U1 small nuclear ribonucleoprotein 70 kDa n=1 Tax=Bifiguratus adelaidae TaxID=1938954 RepID=A0A261Y792_9FUNG|nr:hypothetical protein BZG36_00561 [Bifiguratus adelaidae]
MTDKLPPHLLRLFAPRPPLLYATPLDRAPEERTGAQISGVSDYVELLKDYDKDYVPWKSVAERKKEKMLAKKQAAEQRIQAALAEYNPEQDPNAQGTDAFKSLFVGRVAYDLTERDLQKEFDHYGPVKSVILVKDKDGNSRGYAFIEFERESDMKAAYRDADGVKVNGRRIVVDVERGRTVKEWKPHRLGGGLGKTRVGGPDQNQRYSGREGSTPQHERSGYDRGYDGGGYRSRGGGAYGGGRSGGYGGGGGRGGYGGRSGGRSSYNDGGYGGRGDGGYRDRGYNRYEDRGDSDRKRHRSRSPGRSHRDHYRDSDRDSRYGHHDRSRESYRYDR